MNIKPFIKYFLDINLYNIIFCTIIILFSNFFWGLIMFISIGILIGMLCFNTFKKNEYFAYYNLGITKNQLIKSTFILNSIISVILYLIYKAFC